MKCQKCEKPATFHITELSDDQVSALHYCADCAELYLKPDEDDNDISVEVGTALTTQYKMGQTAEELQELDQKKCPVCETTFYDFRQSGRLGCPHDYEYFADELNTLIVSHYENQAQTLTTGAEANLLKFRELIDQLTPDRLRCRLRNKISRKKHWHDICLACTVIV